MIQINYFYENYQGGTQAPTKMPTIGPTMAPTATPSVKPTAAPVVPMTMPPTVFTGTDCQSFCTLLSGQSPISAGTQLAIVRVSTFFRLQISVRPNTKPSSNAAPNNVISLVAMDTGRTLLSVSLTEDNKKLEIRYDTDEIDDEAELLPNNWNAVFTNITIEVSPASISYYSNSKPTPEFVVRGSFVAGPVDCVVYLSAPSLPSASGTASSVTISGMIVFVLFAYVP